MKTLRLGFAAIVALAALGAAGVCTADRARETIVFWYGASQDERGAYEQMIRDFEKANPGVHVNAMMVPQGYIERKLTLSVAGGVPPDVVRFYAHLGGELMSRGGLEPLDDLVKRDRFDLSDFYQVGIVQNSYKGKLYGIPWILSPNALFYNKKLFREAGFDPERPPKTWAELEKCAMKLTKRDPSGRLVRVGFADFLYNPNNFALYLWQSGGELLEPGGRTAAFDGPTGRRVLAWMKRFLDREVGSVRELQTFSANFKGATQDPFGMGMVAMRVDSPFRIPDLRRYFPELEYGVTAVPYSKKQACEVVGNSLIIPRGSRHREAAWRFIKFASSRQQLINVCKPAGRIPARISAAKSPGYYGSPTLRAFIDQIPTGHSVPIVPGWQKSAELFAQTLNDALEGTIGTDAALAQSAKTMERTLSSAGEDLSKLPKVPWTAMGLIALAALIAVKLSILFYVRRHTAHSRSERQEALSFYLFLAPWLIGFVILTLGAALASLVISFSKWDAISTARFVGARNYWELFSTDPRFLKSIAVTAYYAAFSIPLSIVLGLGVSVLMNQKVFGIRLFRTIYYLPAILSGVATSILWQWLFNPTTGLINQFLMLHTRPAMVGGALTWQPLITSPPGWLPDLIDRAMMLHVRPSIVLGTFTWQPLINNPPGWLLDPKWAMPAFIIMGLWGIGGAMIVYLAALQGIPEETYEAARIDGAGPWKAFRHVTLPLMTPAIFYQLVVGTIYSLQMFTQAYIMTGGGPHDATLFYGLYLFKNTFEWMNMGYGAAMAWMMFAAVLVITLAHFKLASRWVYYEGEK
jgi:ABC-type sugar transport system permease subunit/ABC-type glycerol-3-phosphate transport system substrate-binding protein